MNATSLGWGVGDTIFGRYEVLDVAVGGMAVVYMTYDRQWKRPFAVKCLRPELADDAESIERFHREAQVWVKLGHHPCIVQAEMVQYLGGAPCLFLEFVEGGDLASRLTAGRPPIELALQWAVQFCLGTSYAYKTLGIVHRDIKPSNAMLTASGVVKVTDFGIARSLRSKDRVVEHDVTLSSLLDLPSLTQDGAIVGTLAYIAPEMLTEAKPLVDIRSDMYSFGCMLYELLTGARLFPGESPADLVLPRLEELRIPNLPGLEGVHPAVLRVLAACLRRYPQDRPQSFSDIARDLMSAYCAVTGDPLELPEPEDPDSANAFHNRGVSLATLGFYQEAIEWYSQALQVCPEMPDTLAGLGDALAACHRPHDSVHVYRKCLALYPYDERAQMGLAKSLAAAGEIREAIRELAPLRNSYTYRIPASFMGATLLDQLGVTDEAARWREGVPDRRVPSALDSVRLGSDENGDNGAPGFRVTPFRQRAIKHVKARRGQFSREGFSVELPGGQIIIPWKEINLVLVGNLKEEGPHSEWHYLMDVYLAGHRLRFDSRHMGFLALLKTDMRGSESLNLVSVLQHFANFAPRCRLSPSSRELVRAGPLAIKRYQSLRTFEEHGLRLLRMPKRA